MICDSCGKSNATGVEQCAYCGSEMPKISDCTGFGDILTYKAPEPVVPVAGVGMIDDSGRVSDADMKNLLRKSDSIMRGTKFNLLLVGICAFMLIISILISVFTVSKISNLETTIAEMTGDVAPEAPQSLTQDPTEDPTQDPTEDPTQNPTQEDKYMSETNYENGFTQLLEDVNSAIKTEQ